MHGDRHHRRPFRALADKLVETMVNVSRKSRGLPKPGVTRKRLSL